MLQIEKSLRYAKPLIYWRDKLILAKGVDLYFADQNLESLQKICRLPAPTLSSLIARSRLGARALRFAPGPALELNNDEFLLWFGSRLFCINPQTGTIAHEDVATQGRAALGMGINPTNRAAPEGVYFGDYFSNRSLGPVHIWHRAPEGGWRKAYTFESGQINHIHAVIPDAFSGGLIILSGDYNDAPGIWLAQGNFDSVTRISGDGQDSRACWLKPEKDHLLYATDTHIAPNSVRVLKRSAFGKPTGATKMAATIGSSIYAMGLPDGRTAFSTAVEPGEPTGRKLRDILTRTSGLGIDGPVCGIYLGDADTGFDLGFSRRVDGWPLRLFGFSAFSFPAGLAPSNGRLHCYASGIRGLDGRTVLLTEHQS